LPSGTVARAQRPIRQGHPPQVTPEPSLPNHYGLYWLARRLARPGEPGMCRK